MKNFYLYYIPEPYKKLYFVDFDDKNEPIFSVFRGDSGLFSENSIDSIKRSLNNRYNLNLQIGKWN